MKMYCNIKVNRTIILLIGIIILISGCGRSLSNEELHKKEPFSENETKLNNQLKEEMSKDNNISYNYKAYIGKTWVEENSTENVVSFSIHSIIDNKLKGELSFPEKAVPSSYDINNLTGEVVGDVANCEFSDSAGNKGTIKLLFEDEKIKASVKFLSKLKYAEPAEGEFTFRTYKLTDLKEFDVIDEKVSTKYVNSIGEVTFVPITIPSDTHEPIIVMYLTNKAGEIIFRFFPDLPRGVDIDHVDWIDINNDSLDDIIIVYKAEDYKGDMLEFVMSFVQDANSVFINDRKLDVKINESKIPKDIDSIREYLKSINYSVGSEN